LENLKRRDPLQRPRQRWEDNIRMDLRERVWEGFDWVHLAQDRNQWQDLVNSDAPSCSIKGMEFLD
jgi:hypothetical protein